MDDDHQQGLAAPAHPVVEGVKPSRALVVLDLPLTPLLTVLAAQMCGKFDHAAASSGQVSHIYEAAAPHDFGDASISSYQTDQEAVDSHI